MKVGDVLETGISKNNCTASIRKGRRGGNLTPN